MKLGIRAQVLVAVALVLGFGLLTSYWVTSSVTRDALMDRHVSRLLHLAPVIKSQLANERDRGYTTLRQALMPEQLYVVDQGMTRARYGSEALPEALQDPVRTLVATGKPSHTFVEQSEGVVVVVTIPMGDDAVAVLLSPLESTLERSAMLEGLLLLFTVVILFLALVPGYWILGRLVVRPLTRLVRHVERLGGGEFTQITAADPAPNEMGQLYGALDKMNAQLGRERAKIQEQLVALREAHDGLKDAQDKLVVSEKMAMVGTLAAGVAHEIGNPVAVLQGYIDLLEDTDLTDAQRNQYREAMQQAVQKVSDIISELLVFARPVEDDHAVCDCVAAIRSAVNLIKMQPQLRDIRIEMDEMHPSTGVALARGRLEQVILNLLINSGHASTKGDTVCVTVSTEGQEVLIAVADSGKGIPTENRLRVFDPFFTTKEPGEGTGLGLAICHRIVTCRGGTISVESEEGVGTTFFVRLHRANLDVQLAVESMQG